MDTHAVQHASRAALQPLAAVHRWQVSHDGVIAVADAAVWLTRDGDPDDHVLAPGQTLAVRRGDRLTAEPWRSAQPARLLFVPAARPAWQQAGWQLLARLAGALGARLIALAHSAELQACRTAPAR